MPRVHTNHSPILVIGYNSLGALVYLESNYTDRWVCCDGVSKHIGRRPPSIQLRLRKTRCGGTVKFCVHPATSDARFGKDDMYQAIYPRFAAFLRNGYVAGYRYIQVVEPPKPQR